MVNASRKEMIGAKKNAVEDCHQQQEAEILGGQVEGPDSGGGGAAKNIDALSVFKAIGQGRP